MSEPNTIPKRRNPWISLILNFLLPGTGYIYNGVNRDKTQIVLGSIIFLSYLITFLEFFGVFELTTSPSYATPVNGTIVDLLYFLLPIAFAYDGYHRAKRSITRNRSS